MVGALIMRLRELGAVAEDEPSPRQRLVDDYREYMLVERRLARTTAQSRCEVIGRFLAGRFADDEQLDLSVLGAAELHRYVVGEAARLSRGSVGQVLDGLRSFLRFAYATGLMPADLSAVFPTIATRPHPAVPRAVDPGLLAVLLAGCDRSKPVGLRDFAILTLMGRLGLRGGEVAAMLLDDIDWRDGELLVHGKGGRDARMPLPADVGQPLADYLRKGRPRPAGGCRAVFLRACAPYVALGRWGVFTVPRVACRRCGVSEVGGHQLRRAVAVSVLQGGGSWTELGQLLRHQRSQTTTAYASMAPHALDDVARPWPAVTR
jgi:site-specific recombinase XerD